MTQFQQKTQALFNGLLRKAQLERELEALTAQIAADEAFIAGHNTAIQALEAEARKRASSPSEDADIVEE